VNPVRAFRILLPALLLLSLGALCAAQSNFIVFVALALLAVVGWFLGESGGGGLAQGSPRARSWSLPRWAANTLLMIAVVTALLYGWSERQPVAAFLWLLGSILLLKIWEHRLLRDYGQVLTISVFLSIGATLEDQSLLLGLILIVQLPVLILTVVTYQVCLNARRAGGMRVRLPAIPVFVLATTALVGAVGAGTLVFLVVPRGIGMHQFSEFQPLVVGRTTGFSDTINLDQSGLISESLTPVMDVYLTDGAGNSIGSEDRTVYLRGSVFNAYVNRAWIRSRDVPSLHAAVPKGYAFLGGITRAPDPTREVVQRVIMRSLPRSVTPVFCVWAPWAILATSDTGIRFYADTRTISAEEVRRNRFEYIVRSAPTLPGASVPAAERGTVSFPLQSVRETAARILASAGIDPDPFVRPSDQDGRAARIFEAHLRAEFEYTLDAPTPPVKQDPIDWFLTRSRRGHCEYFASALAALCRSAGIDARVIAGYMVNEFDPAAGAYTVRSNNAHAWVEVNTAPGIWETMDATPHAVALAEREQKRGVLSAIAQWIAGLRDAWNTKVVTFDSTSQDRLLGAETGLAAANDWFRGRSDEAPRFRGVKPLVSGALKIVLPLGVCLGLIIAFRAWRQRRTVRVPTWSSGWALSSRHRRLVRAIDSVFVSLGKRRPHWRPLLLHAEDFAGPQGAILRRAAAAVYADRFGGVTLSSHELRELEAGLRQASARNV